MGAVSGLSRWWPPRDPSLTPGLLQPVALDAPDTTSNYLNDPALRGWYLTLTNGYEKVNTTALVSPEYNLMVDEFGSYTMYLKGRAAEVEKRILGY